MKQQNAVPIQAHIPLFQILTQMRGMYFETEYCPHSSSHPFIPDSHTDKGMFFETTECCPHSSSHPFIPDSHTDEGMYFETTECCPYSSSHPLFQILTQIRKCTLKQNVVPIQAHSPLFQILTQMRKCAFWFMLRS